MFSALFITHKSPRPLVYILLVATLVRIVYLIIYAHLPDWELLTIDNYYHKHWALDIASGNIIGDTTYFRAPFYVYCLAAIFSVFGFSLWAARIFGMIIGLASIFLTYKIGQKLFNQRTAIIASLIQAVFPIVLYLESELLLDALFMFLLELSFYRFIIWYDENSAKNSLLLGLSLGLATLTRPTILIFLLPILVWALLRRSELISRLKNTALILAGLFLLILPITIRNAVVGQEFVPVATQGGINFYIGNNSSADGLSAVMPEPLGHNWQVEAITRIAENELGRDLKPGEVSNYWFDRTLGEISQRPIQTFKLFLKKLYFNFSNHEISSNRNLPDFYSRHILLKLNPLSFGLIFSLAVLGFLSGWKAHWGIRILSGTIMLYVFSVALFFFNSRFRLPVMPLYFILAAAGIESAICNWKSSRRMVSTSLIGAAIAAILSFTPLVSLPKGVQSQHLTLQGLNLYFRGEYESALVFLRPAAQIDPTFPENNLNLGACFLRLGQTDSALFYFEEEKRFHSDRALCHINIASVYLIKNQPEKALVEINRALELQPFNELSQLIRIKAASELNDSINADSLYRLTIDAKRQCPHGISFLNYSAIILTNRGALNPAKEVLITAINTKPMSIEVDDAAFTPSFPLAKQARTKDKALASYQLGFIYGLEGNFSKSIEQSQNAIALDSNLVEAYVNLINGLNAAGLFAKADSVKNIALSRFPESPFLK